MACVCLCLCSCLHICIVRACVFVVAGRLRAELETKLVNLFISVLFISPAAGEMKGLPQYVVRACTPQRV